MAKTQGILLEAGTNEMELLIFQLNGTPFGINVAKVREIIQRPKTISIPHAPNAVEGSFKLRDKVLTLINLGTHFGMVGDEIDGGEGMCIIVEFNAITCGILVDSVQVIHRLRWDEIEPPSQYLCDMNIPVTGMAHVSDTIVLVADFETIVSEILGVENAFVPEITQDTQMEKKDVRIVLADDSNVIRKQLLAILNKFGYVNVQTFSDGQQAWDHLEAKREIPTGPCDLVLTDIEMPQMDGLHLTSKIKNDPQLQHLPVVLFSSLITDDNRRKGESVGANAQISKPNSQELIDAIENCLEGRLQTEELQPA